MLIPFCVLITFVVITHISSSRHHKMYREFRLLALKSNDQYKTHAQKQVELIRLLEAQLASKDVLIGSLENQIGNLKDTVENLVDLKDGDDPNTVFDAEEDSELVYASHLYTDSVHDQRVLKANAVLTLHEAAVTLEREKKNIPPETYEKLYKHLRMDS